MKLLILDVEGTIITDYNYDEMIGDRFKAVIDPALKEILSVFHDANFKILLATGTDSDNLTYYNQAFHEAGFDHLIDYYSPYKHEHTDSKETKLEKYQLQFGVLAYHIYFFDDAAPNVKRAIEKGYVNSFTVTKEKSLVTQLKKLAQELGLNNKSNIAFNASTTQDLSSHSSGASPKYATLLLPFRQYLSAETQKTRHEKYNHISTEEFWDTKLTSEEKDSLYLKYI